MFSFFRKHRATARTQDSAADLYRVVTRPNGDWSLKLRTPLRTHDSAQHPMVYRRPHAPARDTLLTSPTKNEMGAYFRGRAKVDLGLVWHGDLKPLGDAIAAVKFELARVTDSAQRAAATSRAVVDIASFGNSLGNGSNTGTMRESGFGSHGTGGYAGPEREVNLGSTAEPQDVQRANEDYWDSIGNRYITRDTRRGAGLIASINSANARLWANPEPFRFGRPWGKG